MRAALLTVAACAALLAGTVPASARSKTTCPLSTTTASRLVGGHLVRGTPVPGDWCVFLATNPTKILQIGPFPTSELRSLRIARSRNRGAKEIALPSAGAGAFVAIRHPAGGTTANAYAPHVQIYLVLGGRYRNSKVATLVGRIFRAVYKSEPRLRA
jgi:hypothetical protein